MPFSYAIDAERRRVNVTAAGPCETDAIIRQIQEVIELVPLAGFGVLADCREIEFVPNTRDLYRLVDVFTAYTALRSARTAIVVTRPIFVGLANVFATLSSLRGATVESFRSTDDAERWLQAT